MLKPDFIKTGAWIILVSCRRNIFSSRFCRYGNAITNIYDEVFIYFDFPIAIIALILIIFVVYKILLSAKESEKEFKIIKHKINQENFTKGNVKKVHHSHKHGDFDYEKKMESIKNKSKKFKFDSKIRNKNPINEPKNESEVKLNDHESGEKPQSRINKSSGNIQFESNDLLDDYKK